MIAGVALAIWLVPKEREGDKHDQRAPAAVATPSPTMPPQVAHDMAKLFHSGYARIDRRHLARVYVEPAFWYRLDAEEKENWVKIFSAYCNFPEPARSAEVYSNSTGRKLAEMDPWSMGEVRFY